MTIVMAAVGSITGVAVALTAFAYDGSQPVNVVRLLALLVGVQLVLLAFTLLLLPGRVPGLRHIQDLLTALNPGAWAAGVYAKLAHASPDAARCSSCILARPAARRFAKWQLLYWSQTAAVMFNLAALVTAIMLVTFSDLAFGWSTTLDIGANAASRIVQAIARPWAPFAPLAVPSPELVEQSQFFRLERADIVAGSPRALGAWWPFTLFALVTYGLLPRLLLLVLAAVRLRAATGALLLEDSRVTALLDRMASPAIETAAAAARRRHRRRDRSCYGRAHRPMTGSARALIWESSLSPDAARSYARRHLGLEVLDVAEAGAGQLTTDRAALEQPRDRSLANVDRLHAGMGTAATRASRFSRGAAAAYRPGRLDRRGAGTRRPTCGDRRSSARRGNAQSRNSRIRRSTSRRAPHESAAFRNRRPSKQG